MAKPVVPSKRFSLNGLIEGWTDEHYIQYRPFSFSDVEAIKNVDEGKLEAVNSFTEMLRDHFVGGAWLVADDDGQNERTEPMVAANVLDLPVEITGLWLRQAMGNADPKQLAN